MASELLFADLLSVFMDLKCNIKLIHFLNLVFPDKSSPEYNDPTGK